MRFMVSGPEPADSGEWTTASGWKTSSIVLMMSSTSPLLQLQWNRSKVATLVLVGVVDTVLLAYGSGPICQPQSQVLAVVDGFVEQLRDVVVVEAVDDAASAAGAAHQSEIAQQA